MLCGGRNGGSPHHTGAGRGPVWRRVCGPGSARGSRAACLWEHIHLPPNPPVSEGVEEAGDRVTASKTRQVWRTEGGSGAPDGCPGWRGAVTARKTERGWLGGLHREEGTLCVWMLDTTLCGLEPPEDFRESGVGPRLLLKRSPWQHVGKGVGKGGDS